MASFSEVVYTDPDFEIYIAAHHSDGNAPRNRVKYYTVVVDGRIIYTGTSQIVARAHMNQAVEDKIKAKHFGLIQRRPTPDHYGDW